MKKLLIFLIMHLVYTTYALAQDYKQSFVFHLRYGNMLEGASGLTLNNDSYKDKLCQGVNWDAQYHIKTPKRADFGMLYSGYSTKAAHEEGADHIYTHYIAPQGEVYAIDNNSFQLRINAGVSWMFYENDGEVFSKSRKTSTSNLAENIGIHVNYKLGKI